MSGVYRLALTTAALLLATSPAIAQQSTKADVGEPCTQGNNHLDSESWSLVTDCVASAYCSSEGTCEPKRCRKDTFPFGYNDVPYDALPPMCGEGYFCPDEGDQCLPNIAVGQPCQKDRDDECQPPSNWRELNGFLNTNGSICLNFTCEYANATVGQECIIDNTAYATYLDSGGVSTFIISRDNCRNGLYCDGTALRCFQDKREGQSCTGNKECLSYNCGSNGKCGRAADEPIQAPAYAYALIAVGIVLIMIGTFVTLWFMHKRFRKENQIKLEQYYNEQIAYRQSIMSMSQAKNNLLSADGTRAPYTDDPKGSPLARGPGMLPPNMTRESSAWSDADSEILNDQVNHHLPEGQGQSSHPRMHGGVL